MSDYVGSDLPYYAKDGKVWKAAERKSGPNGGTSITMGFPVCVMHGAAEGQEAAVAALMNRGDIADELVDALKAVMAALRVHAPGTPLNNHSFDALGAKAYAAIAKADKIP